jgi:hypothetical protein
VTAVRPPRVVEGRIELHYPPYTRLKPQTVDTLNLKVPEGTEMRWRLTFDRPVRDASMRWEEAEAMPMRLADGGRVAELRRTAEASRAYRVDLRWRLGDREIAETGTKHYLQVIPDADPQVGLLRPAEDAKATLRKSIALAFWARDDYGLGEAWIVYSINDGGERRHPLGSLAGTTHAEREAAWPIAQLLTGLKANDIVTFAVEVSDGRPGTPGRGRSVSRRVQFVPDADYLAYVQARQRKLLGQLRPLYLQEKEAAGHLDSVEGAAAPAPKAGPASGGARGVAR